MRGNSCLAFESSKPLAENKMSTFAHQSGYFKSNDENRDAAKFRAIDGEGLVSKVPVLQKRTVLGSITNRPFSNVSIKSKQVKTEVSVILDPHAQNFLLSQV